MVLSYRGIFILVKYLVKYLVNSLTFVFYGVVLGVGFFLLLIGNGKK